MSEHIDGNNSSTATSKEFFDHLLDDGKETKPTNVATKELITYEVIQVDDHITNINIAQFLSDNENEIIDDKVILNTSDIPDPEYPESEEDLYEEEDDIWDDFNLGKQSKQKLNNNHVEKISKKEQQKRAKTMVRYKRPPMVQFDEETKFLLRRLVQTRFMGRYHGIIGTGTSSIVLFGHCCTCVSMKMPWEATVKVYKNDKTHKETVYKRVQNEFRSLDRIFRCHINVPMPVCAWRNIIMMGSIGYGNNTSIFNAPPEFDNRNYWHIIDSMKRMYQIAKIVHGNLSHRSILWHGQPYFISLGHSVPADHPNALKLLIRDCFNVNNVSIYYALLSLKSSLVF